MPLKRKGFTLVELLVVIAIIGMLVGLLLPAVQQAREAARQMQCNNHLRQLAIACLNYESQMQALPSGGWDYNWVGDPDRGLGVEQPGGWGFQILPFMEQNALFQLGADEKPDEITSTQKNGAWTCNTTPLPFWNCPSRRPAQIYEVSWTPHNCNALTQAVKGDYGGNYGSHPTDQRNLPANFPQYCNSLPAAKTFSWITPVAGGVIFDRSRVTIGEIRDGTTNTYLVGEKYCSPQFYESTFFGKLMSNSEDNSTYCGLERDCTRTCGKFAVSNTSNNILTPYPDREGFDEQTYRYGSAHAGSVGMGMCDGSVQRISYSIEPRVHACLGTRNDGEVVSLEP